MTDLELLSIRLAGMESRFRWMKRTVILVCIVAAAGVIMAQNPNRVPEGTPRNPPIVEGEVRAEHFILVDAKGKEHIVQFAPENWWISAKPAAVADGPSRVFIEAIEDSDVLLIDREGHVTLMEKMPGYAKSFVKGLQRRDEAREKRIVHSLSSTAEERYNDFLENYFNIAQRVPQHMLASYLGITPETLSRIRRKALSKK